MTGTVRFAAAKTIENRALTRKTAAEAQLHKLNRICELLELRPDDHLLEVGCGWGGLAIHAARHWGSKVTAATNSRETVVLKIPRFCMT